MMAAEQHHAASTHSVQLLHHMNSIQQSATLTWHLHLKGKVLEDITANQKQRSSFCVYLENAF